VKSWLTKAWDSAPLERLDFDVQQKRAVTTILQAVAKGESFFFLESTGDMNFYEVEKFIHCAIDNPKECLRMLAQRIDIWEKRVK